MAFDKTYLQVNDGLGEAALAHVTNSRSIGATTIEVDTVANWPTKFVATYGELLPSGFIDPSTAVLFYGHLSGSDLEIDGFMPGSVDNGNQTTDVVVIRPNGFVQNFVGESLDNIMLPDGSALDSDVINTGNIVDEAVTTGKLDDGAVTEVKLDADSVSNAKLKTGSGEPGGVWDTYPVVWSTDGTQPSIGNGSLAGRCKKVGRTVYVEILLVYGSTTNSGSGQFMFSLPFPKRVDGLNVTYAVGTCQVVEAGVAGYPGFTNLIGTGAGPTYASKLQPVTVDITNGRNKGVNASSPFAIGSTDTISLSARYEAAS